MAAIAPSHSQDSESDNDPDFVPEDAASDSESSGDDVNTGTMQNEPSKLTEEQIIAEKQAKARLWEEFQASASKKVSPSHEAAVPKTVKVEKRYRFAGEDVVEVVDVPEDSDDAKKWPIWRPPEDGSLSTLSAPSEEDAQDRLPLPQHSMTITTSTVLELVPSKPPPSKRPGPRKPKTSLAPLPSSSTQKAKKLTTLEKSAMDWRAHVSSAADSSERDELEANRRGGGYLEKVEFLDRVGQRKEEILDQEKSAKRRRL